MLFPEEDSWGKKKKCIFESLTERRLMAKREPSVILHQEKPCWLRRWKRIQSRCLERVRHNAAPWLIDKMLLVAICFVCCLCRSHNTGLIMAEKRGSACFICDNRESCLTVIGMNSALSQTIWQIYYNYLCFVWFRYFWINCQLLIKSDVCNDMH